MSPKKKDRHGGARSRQTGIRQQARNWTAACSRAAVSARQDPAEQTEEQQSMRSMDRACSAAPWLLALGLYLNTLNADFAYDDSRAILKNPDLQSSTPLLSLFANDFWGTPLTHSGSHKSYRPLCVLTFRLNAWLHGLHPLGFHLVNVLLHAAVSALFARTALRLFPAPSRFPAWVAGMLFAAHPVHTEAVAGVVGRADLLACLGFLLALRCYMRYCVLRDRPDHPQGKWAALAGVASCTAAAMLCKEQGVTVLAVCATYDIFVHSRLSFWDLRHLHQRRFRRAPLEGLLFLVLLGGALISLRLSFMGNQPPEFAPADNPASDSNSLLTRTLTFSYLPFLNFWLLLFPRTLSFDWSMGAVPLLESASDTRNLCSLVFYAMIGYAGFQILCHINARPPPAKAPNGIANGTATHAHRRGSSSSTDDSEGPAPSPSPCRGHLPTLALALSMVCFPFLPASNLFFYVGFVVAERVLYIPSLGFCLMVAHGAHLLRTRCVHRQRLLHAALAALVLSYGMRTVLRNEDWRSEERLYRAGIAVNPAKAWGNLANILNAQGKRQEAEAAYKAALSHRANMADVHYNLGILYQEQEKYHDAIASYKRAIQCRPRLTMAHLNLGIVYSAVSMKSEAEQIYRHCAEIDITGLKDPRLHENTKISALYNLGRLLADQDRHQEAIAVYEEAIQRRPAHYGPQSLYNMLGESHFKLDHLAEAEKWYQAALRVKPDHAPAHLTMGKLIQRKGDPVEAEKWFLEAKKLDPLDSSVHQHYGQFLSDVGRYDEAAESYLLAVNHSTTKDDFELIFNTANVLRQAGRNQEAEDFYHRAALLRPNLATAHMNLGAMLHLNGKLEAAERSYQAALRLQPGDRVTQANLQKLRNLRARKGT